MSIIFKLTSFSFILHGVIPKQLSARNIHQLYYTARWSGTTSSVVRLSVRYNKLGFILHSAIR